MIHILYLAAGNSRRFGENKLLRPLDGKPLYLWNLEKLVGLTKSRSDCDLTVLSQCPEIFQAAQDMGARSVDSPLSIGGLSYTIRAGIQSLDTLEEEDFFLFVLADQPWMSQASIARMLDAAVPGCTAATASFQGHVGSPTLFAATLVPELMELRGDQGGRVILDRYYDQVRRIEVDSPLEFEDVDRPEDLKKGHGACAD